MVRDDRLYAFIIGQTSRSRARIRRIAVHKRWLKLSALITVIIFSAAVYGIYGLTQHLRHLQVEQENARLRAENERQRRQLQNLNNRVEAVEDTSRKLAEKNGVNQEEQPALNGAGGPFIPLDAAAALEFKTRHLEQQLQFYEILRQQSVTPSIWPVEGGRLTDGFGDRRNPFGGYSSEFHAGQDIATNYGTPVIATANGVVTFAGCQSGYGQVVVIDHGDGLTTRYGHLSHIDAVIGQNITRGDMVGKVGSTGRSTGPHVHYEIRINDEPVDPTPYLPGLVSQESQ
jgi:murein DD-endopeptidase MepM/ murein hydrolase activator NlpD